MDRLDFTTRNAVIDPKVDFVTARRSVRFVERDARALHYGSKPVNPQLGYTRTYRALTAYITELNPSGSTKKIRLRNLTQYVDDFFHQMNEHFCQIWQTVQAIHRTRIQTAVKEGGKEASEWMMNLHRFNTNYMSAVGVYTLIDEDLSIYSDFMAHTLEEATNGCWKRKYNQNDENERIEEKKDPTVCYKLLTSHLLEVERKAGQLPCTLLYRCWAAKISLTEGQMVTLTSFTSTSRSREIATAPFKGNPSAAYTVLKFVNFMSGIELGNMSCNPEDEEVLLFPYQTFEVENIEINGSVTEITLGSQLIEATMLFEDMARYFPLASQSFEFVNYALFEDLNRGLSEDETYLSYISEAENSLQNLKYYPVTEIPANLIYELKHEQGHVLLLNSASLRRIEYVYPSFDDISVTEQLPDYHILDRITFNDETHLFIKRELIFINFPALRERWRKGVPIYCKSMVINEQTSKFVGSIRFARVASEEFADYEAQIAMNDPEFAQYNCYLLTTHPASSLDACEKEIKAFLPHQHHSLIKPCQIVYNFRGEMIDFEGNRYYIRRECLHLLKSNNRQDTVSAIVSSSICINCGKCSCTCGAKDHLYEYFKEKSNYVQEEDKTQNKAPVLSFRCDRFVEKNSGAFLIGERDLSIETISDYDDTKDRFKKALEVWSTHIQVFTRVDVKFNSVWFRAMGQIINRLSECDLELLRNVETFGANAVTGTMIYSLEDPQIYSKLNAWVRGQAIPLKNEDSSTSKSFLTDYSYNILTMYLTEIEWKVSNLPEGTVLYRGCGIAFDAQQGECVAFHQFVSTSLNPSVASELAADGIEHRTLFKLTGPMSGIQLGRMSEFPDEFEVLLAPYHTFRVESINVIYDENGPITEITLRSQIEEAIELFRKINQYYPPDTNLPEHFIYKMVIPKIEFIKKNPEMFVEFLSRKSSCFINDIIYLKSSDLRRARYVHQSFANADNLPEYHLIKRFKGSYDSDRTEIEVMFLNYPALIPRLQKEKQIYEKRMFERNGTCIKIILSSITWRKLVPYIQTITKATIQDKQPYNCYVISTESSFAADSEEWIKRLFPERFGEEIKICHIFDKELVNKESKHSN